MEKKAVKESVKKREIDKADKAQIPASVKVVIGGLAYGIIKNASLEGLLDEESHHEFQNNITILTEFVTWFKHPEIRVLKSRDHVTVFRYLLSVYMRAYHRNIKHKILIKLSSDDDVKVVIQ